MNTCVTSDSNGRRSSLFPLVARCVLLSKKKKKSQARHSACESVQIKSSKKKKKKILKRMSSGRRRGYYWICASQESNNKALNKGCRKDAGVSRGGENRFKTPSEQERSTSAIRKLRLSRRASFNKSVCALLKYLGLAVLSIQWFFPPIWIEARVYVPFHTVRVTATTAVKRARGRTGSSRL